MIKYETKLNLTVKKLNCARRLSSRMNGNVFDCP